jgi:hypothetical protein
VAAPTAWVEGTLPADWDASLQPRLLTYNGATLLLVASEPGKPGSPPKSHRVWTSTDATSWTARTLPIPKGGQLTGILATNDGFLARGYRTVKQQPGPTLFWSSPDGLTWTPVETSGLKGAFLNGLTVGPAGLVALGSTLVKGNTTFGTWSSPDGVAWKRHLFDKKTAPAFRAPLAFALAPDGSMVASWSDIAGQGDLVMRSPDGVKWKPTKPDFNGYARTFYWDGARFQGLFNEDGAMSVRSSHDGSTWTSILSQDGNGGALVQTAGGLLAVLAGHTFFSADGVTWTPLADAPGTLMIMAGGPGGAALLTSDDGAQHLWLTE